MTRGYYQDIQEAQVTLVLAREKEKADAKALEKADAEIREAELKVGEAKAKRAARFG